VIRAYYWRRENNQISCRREDYETVLCFRNVGYDPWRRSDRFHWLRWFIKHNASTGCIHHQLHGKCSDHYGGTKHDPDGGVRQRNRDDYAGECCRYERNSGDCDSDRDDDVYADSDSNEWVGGDGDYHGYCEPVADDRELRGQSGDDYGGTERDFDWGVC